MPRVKRGTINKKRHKKVLELAKGYRGAKSRVFRRANEQVLHSLSYAYRDRRQRRRDFRKLWIIRINAAARQNGISYSRFMNGLKTANIEIDRKVLADMAVHDGPGFSRLAELVKNQVTETPKAEATV
ncbi:MAG: 50S ribosomal protein L20 [Actinomycetota bacterium]|nr:50S ribosomal protein L20 [Actinomycetota bacterium]